jgi:hypothetical protein
MPLSFFSSFFRGRGRISAISQSCLSNGVI